jgi:photosystem II stability/assembly factor-like uncharacterized protein
MTHSQRIKLPLIIFGICYSAFIFQIACVFAHTPHDVIDTLELSPDFAQDKTLFIGIEDQLKRSSDKGYTWKNLVYGLDNRHYLSSIVCSPAFTLDKTVLVSTAGDGIYRSQNAGNSWKKINSGLDNLNVRFLKIPPFRSDRLIIFASTGSGLYKTIDGGEKWYPVLKAKSVTAVSFFPPAKKWGVIAGDALGNIYLSADDGETWSKQFTKSEGGAIQAIAIPADLDSSQLYFLGTEKSGVYKTVDGGKTFVEVNRGLPESANVMSIVVSPAYRNDKTVYLTTWYEALYISTNGGQSWQKYDDGLTTDRQADSQKYRSAHFRDLKIARGTKDDLTFFLAGFDGLFKSDEGGKKWTELETLLLRRIMGLGLSPPDRGKISVGITTYGGGAYSTEADGLTWKINNMGLITTRLSDIVFSPNYSVDNTIFSASHGYMLKSTNRGAHWTKSSLRIENWRRFGIGVLKRLKIPTDRLKKSILSPYERSDPFATVIALSPHFSSDQTLFFGTRRHGIFRSLDAGAHNRVVWKAMAKVIDSLALSPAFRSDRTIFSGIRDGGVFKSVDNGESWQQVFKLGDNQFSKYLVVISNDFKFDRTVFVGTSDGLYKTTDAGEHWHPLPIAEEEAVASVNALAISPNYEMDQTLLLSIKGKGILKSWDGGRTFQTFAPAMIRANHELKWIRFSNAFAADRIIYGASYEELFRSNDGGHTWQPIERPVRYENHRDVVRYEGDWKPLHGENLSATRLSYTDSASAAVSLRFFGSGVSVIGPKSKDHGKARVYIDGAFRAEVDQFSQTTKSLMEIYSIRNLPRGPHEIRIETLDKNAAARVAIDAFDIAP